MKHLVEILLVFAVLSTSINVYLYKSNKDTTGVLTANQHLNKENAELEIKLSNSNTLVDFTNKERDSFLKEIHKKDSIIIELDNQITDLATMILKRVDIKPKKVIKKSSTKFDNLWQNSRENSVQYNN